MLERLHLVLGLSVFIVIGTLLILIPGASQRQLSFLEAFFTSTSASEVTGLSLFPISTDLTIWGQLILLALIQIGGVGFIITVILVFRLLGRQVMLGERLAVTSSLGLEHPKEFVQIMGRAIGLMLSENHQAGVLSTMPFGQRTILAWFQAVSAYSTTRLSLGITAGLNTINRLILIFTMFAGRLGAITIMISMLGQDSGKNLVDYPEESIFIG